MDAVFASALAKSPDDRQDSCLAFVAELRAAVGGGSRAAHPPTQVDVDVAQLRETPAPQHHPGPRDATGAGRPMAPPPEPPAWAHPVYRR